MARMKYVQWTPIAPLNLFGRINATICSLTAPDYDNQIAVAEDAQTDGYIMDLILLQMILP